MTDLSASLRALSEPWERGDKIKTAIARSARAADLTYWRAFDIWYGKALAASSPTNPPASQPRSSANPRSTPAMNCTNSERGSSGSNPYSFRRT